MKPDALLDPKYKILQINEKGEAEFTTGQIDQVRKLAAYHEIDFIADIFGISRSTFYRIRKRQPAVQTAYDEGVANSVGLVAQKLLQKALGGCRVSMIFYLKAKGGWSEKRTVEHVGLPGDPSLASQTAALKDMSNEEAGALLKEYLDHEFPTD